MNLLDELQHVDQSNISLTQLKAFSQKIEAFACINRGVLGDFSTRTTSKKEWNVIAIAHHFEPMTKKECMKTGQELLKEVIKAKSVTYKSRVTTLKNSEERTSQANTTNTTNRTKL